MSLFFSFRSDTTWNVCMRNSSRCLYFPFWVFFPNAECCTSFPTPTLLQPTIHFFLSISRVPLGFICGYPGEWYLKNFAMILQLSVVVHSLFSSFCFPHTLSFTFSKHWRTIRRIDVPPLRGHRHTPGQCHPAYQREMGRGQTSWMGELQKYWYTGLQKEVSSI